MDAKDEDTGDGKTAARAIALLDQLKDKPFFLAVSFLKPHVPLVAPKPYFDRYDMDAIALPPAVSGAGEDLSGVPKPALRTNFDLFRARTPTPQEAKEAVRAYHACTSFMDAQVGCVLDQLDKLGLPVVEAEPVRGKRARPAPDRRARKEVGRDGAPGRTVRPPSAKRPGREQPGPAARRPKAPVEEGGFHAGHVPQRDGPVGAH